MSAGFIILPIAIAFINLILCRCTFFKFGLTLDKEGVDISQYVDNNQLAT